MHLILKRQCCAVLLCFQIGSFSCVSLCLLEYHIFFHSSQLSTLKISYLPAGLPFTSVNMYPHPAGNPVPSIHPSFNHFCGGGSWVSDCWWIMKPRSACCAVVGYCCIVENVVWAKHQLAVWYQWNISPGAMIIYSWPQASTFRGWGVKRFRLRRVSEMIMYWF